MRCARLPAQPRKFVLGEVTMLSLSVRHRFRHALYRLAAPKIYLLLLLLLQQRLLHVSPNRLGDACAVDPFDQTRKSHYHDKLYSFDIGWDI